ncbi:MAG: ATP-binding protein [Propionicimonas sp.]
MRIVVSGTHASGKSTLISDFAGRHQDFEVFDDPYELLEATPAMPDAATFLAQFAISAERLHQHEGGNLIAERGPLDFVAYLDALARLGRGAPDATTTRQLFLATAAAMTEVDVVVLLPLNAGDHINISDEEDPELRVAMNDILIELADDPELIGGATVVEIVGDPAARVRGLEAALDSLW